MKAGDTFSSISRKVSEVSGSWQASAIAIFLVVAWIFGGLLLGYSDSYQLIANTGTTLVTFIMVFLIQSAQNRDTKALHIKIDELLCSVEKANEQLIDIEKSTDDQIEQARKEIGTNKITSVDSGSSE